MQALHQLCSRAQNTQPPGQRQRRRNGRHEPATVQQPQLPLDRRPPAAGQLPRRRPAAVAALAKPADRGNGRGHPPATADQGQGVPSAQPGVVRAVRRPGHHHRLCSGGGVRGATQLAPAGDATAAAKGGVLWEPGVGGLSSAGLIVLCGTADWLWDRAQGSMPLRRSRLCLRLQPHSPFRNPVPGTHHQQHQ